jgi:hypothetical protein
MASQLVLTLQITLVIQRLLPPRAWSTQNHVGEGGWSPTIPAGRAARGRPGIGRAAPLGGQFWVGLPAPGGSGGHRRAVYDRRRLAGPVPGGQGLSRASRFVARRPARWRAGHLRWPDRSGEGRSCDDEMR